MNFKGKKILVTGATGGIGGAIIKKFLSLNASVLGTGTNQGKLELLKKEFPNLITESFDISKIGNNLFLFSITHCIIP